MIKFKSSKIIAPAAIFDLYKAVGWAEGIENPRKHAALLAKVYANSDLVFSAWEGKKLVGVIRAITDKYAHGCIFGFAVEPAYRGQGIGSKLLELCLKKYPKIQWSAAAEAGQLVVFAEQGFAKSKNEYLEKGICPV